jgi:hypothetical protein
VSSTRRGLAVLIIAMITAGGALSACTDDSPTPPATTTAPIPTTPATTPTATPPAIPAAKPTAASAEAFVKYFWDVYNFAYETLDTDPLQQISTTSCKFCESTLNEVSALKQAGKHITGGGIQLETVVAPPGDPTNGVIVTMVLNQMQGQTLNADGTVSSTIHPVNNMRSEVALRWRESHWFVYGVANEKPGPS